MSIESFLVTALPYSADPASARHLSLFITHRLTPDGAQGVVGDFAHVRDWTAQLAGATITVSGRVGTAPVAVPVTPLLDVLEPDLWRRVFPADLVVLPWQTPDPTAVPWRTFPAHRMQAQSLLVHGLSLLSSPVSPPLASENVLANSLLQSLFDLPTRGGADGNNRRVSVDFVLEHIEDIDRRVSAELDRLVIAAPGSTTISGMVNAPVTTSATMLLAGDAHLARRYYQRPEEQHDYLPAPNGSATPPVLQASPDFHRRASLLGDLSPLLRRLGLIIDVRVDDVTLLAGLTEISASLDVPGLSNPVGSQPRIACVVNGTSFAAGSGTGDYTQGMVRLGNEDSFTVLDLDPDAQGLKLEQYVRNVPRMAAVENNGDTGSAAPSTLRSTGFSFARNDRAAQLHDQLSDAPSHDAQVMAGQSAPLHLEDVARGVRLEVWDDVSTTWHSLHRRRLTVDVVDGGDVLTDAPDTGFLQGASLTRADGVDNAPVNAHEVLAGWEGWSVSAPRPGKRIVHDQALNGGPVHEAHADPHEKLEDPPAPNPDAEHPVATVTAVEPGTLPRLRYGRNYAFRAWAVDLAGNSPPHTVAGPVDGGDGGVSGPTPSTPEVPPDPAVTGRAAAIAQQHLSTIDPDAIRFTGAAAPIAAAGVPVLRRQLASLRPAPPVGPQGIGARGIDLSTVSVTGVGDLDRLVVNRALAAPTVAVPRQARIEQTVDRLAPATSAILQRTDTRVAPTVFASALSAAALAHPGLSSDGLVTLLPDLLDVVTTPRPFLRWEPVLEPTVVPRHAYTEGESLVTLVIRSGVEGPGPDGVTMTVVAPDTYVPAVLAAHPELDLHWHVDSQRHLVPPKTSQYECELHGLFDQAFGSGDPAQIKAALAVALRESGTLLDTTIADPDTPGARIAQPGVSLVTGPTADDPTHTDPDTIPRGDGLSRGQYAIHDVDSLRTPYLPDPLADGVSFVFPDGGRGTELTGLLAVEGTHLPYPGTWPDRAPWRLVLGAGDRLAADAENGVVTLGLPAGQQLRMRLSSSVRADQLDLLGLWHSLPDEMRTNQLLLEAASDGWLWWLTPATQLRLVHAVPRPLEAPRFTLLRPSRGVGSTTVTLFAGVDLHGPSTDRLDIEATWSEWVDDVTKPAPQRIDVTAAVAHTEVAVDEDLVVLAGDDEVVPLPDGTSITVHAALHHLGDTRHRTIDYRLRGTSRFREYFDPHLVPTIDDISVVGPVQTANVLSSARPAKPLVRDVIPLLRWHSESEEGQPFGLSRSRLGGVRIYLDRPWFSSGDDELLGVVLQHGSDASAGDWVSQWGGDPVFAQDGPAARGAVPLSDLLHLSGLDDRTETARPVTLPATVALVDVPGQPAATVLGYRPEFSPERGMWFVDIAIDPGTAFWPFLRLTVARYQPNSIAGLMLSPLVNCDFVQVLPQRTALLSRPDAGHARVVITGPVGVPGGFGRQTFPDQVAASRTMRARLENRDPSIATDLGWTTVAATELPVGGVNATMVSWEGELALPTPIAPQRPGDNADWRVVVEEWEHLRADPVPDSSYVLPIVGVVGVPRTGTRIVYADHLPL